MTCDGGMYRRMCHTSRDHAMWARLTSHHLNCGCDFAPLPCGCGANVSYGDPRTAFVVAQPRFPDPIRHASELEFVELLETQVSTPRKSHRTKSEGKPLANECQVRLDRETELGDLHRRLTAQRTPNLDQGTPRHAHTKAACEAYPGIPHRTRRTIASIYNRLTRLCAWFCAEYPKSALNNKRSSKSNRFYWICYFACCSVPTSHQALRSASL